MEKSSWCEHEEKISKYTLVNYFFCDTLKVLRIQSWLCPICGIHGASSEVIVSNDFMEI